MICESPLHLNPSSPNSAHDRAKGASALITQTRSTVHRWWPFLLLLVAGASRWVVSAAHPEADSTLASEALGCTWAALLSLTFLLRRPSPSATRRLPLSKAGILRCVLAGAMLFGGPAVALLLRGRVLDAGSLTIALALTPIIIAVAAAALGTDTSDGIAGRIWPGLAAIAGLLLLLSQPTLGDARSDLALVLAPALTGVGAALFCVDQPTSATRITSALFGASTLFVLALMETHFVSGARLAVSLLAVACDGVLALLGIISLAQLGATRWSSQFTWIPLLIVVEGIVLVRPQLTAHWFIGLLLLATASIYLLLPAADQSAPDTSAVHG
jgi:drug/metabolite transporter (DMT)-like permease